MTQPTESEYLSGFFHRTTMLLGPAAMASLRGKTVAVAGCGGVGGAAAITLARLGVGGFVLADPGIFDPPDGNRQWAAHLGTQGRNKARVHAEILRSINPGVRLTVFEEGLTEDNLDAFFASADVLLDCLDISVPLALRGRVYRTAMARGLYALTSPIFGFGTMLVVAEPGGMGMDELIASFVRVASSESKLPAGFPDHFFGPHVDAIEREIHKHRVPTSGIAVTLAAGLVSAEIARLFLREHHPELEGPPVLPDVFAIEPLRRTFRVLHHRELFRERLVDGPEARSEALAAAGHHVLAVPRGRVSVDLSTDCNAELLPTPADRRSAPEVDPGSLLSELYGFPEVFAVGRGRLAEALLAPLVVRPGAAVAMVSPFPTTRFHVEEAGGRVVEVGVGSGDFAGDVDLARLTRVLDTGTVAAIWLEPNNNTLAGAPCSLANLREVRRLADAHGVSLVLDTTRVFENAVLVREREPEQRGRPVAELVREICGLADALAGSLTKDLVVAKGGMVAARSDRLRRRLRDRVVLMVGDGLDGDARARLADVSRRALASGTGAEARVAAVRSLAVALEAAGAPVVRPLGGHAVFVDAARVFPWFTLDDHADHALADAWFVRSGVRVSAHMDDRPDRRLVRISVPVTGLPADAGDRLVRGFAEVVAEREAWPRLERLPAGPGGQLGAWSFAFRPRGAR